MLSVIDMKYRHTASASEGSATPGNTTKERYRKERLTFQGPAVSQFLQEYITDVATLAQFSNRGTSMLVSRLKKFKGDLPVCDT